MRIVITGATGSLGTALLRRLLADGEHDVVGLARRPPDRGAAETNVELRWRAWTLLAMTSPALDGP